MNAYRKINTKNIILGIVSIVLLFWVMCASADAQESIKVYNKNEEVTLLHELFYHNEQYYLHLNDLQQLGLDVSEDNNTYTISSKDCLGEERILTIKPLTMGSGDIIITPITTELMSLQDSVTVDTVICSGTYKHRSVKKLGYSTDNIISATYEGSFSANTNAMIEIEGELYISAQFVGNQLSHMYSLENNRIDFYIADDNAMIMETTVNLVRGTVAPSGGHNVKIYTAYKTGEGNTIDDFEVLSSYDCTIKENERSATCLIETPAEKIGDSNLYFVVDFGERYELALSEYNFLYVGNVLVYGQQKDVTYTVDVNLPEIDEMDVPFTVYVEANNQTYSKQGVVKSGEKSTVFEFEGIPLSKRYSTRIEFDYHKYKNAVLEDIIYFINAADARDFETNFTAEYSRSVVCTVSLPDNFVCDGDVEVKVQLSKHISNASMSVVDKLTDWNDSKTITLNNEKRSEQIYLYSQASASQLSYELVSDVEGLCQKGYLRTDEDIASDSNSLKKITEDLAVRIQLLQKKTITVNVFRPYGISVENDIFATAVLDDISTSLINDVVLDFTQTPLISSGERKSQFKFDVAEDKSYKFEINNITGDERLFEYYCYVWQLQSPADKGQKRQISFKDNSIDISLLKCINVVGTVECENMKLDFDALATCHLYNGKTIHLTSNVENGVFSFKIPEDTDTYTLDVQTRIGKKSYYVSDGVSTNNEDEATEFFFVSDEDKTVVIEYILQNPAQPIEISYLKNNGIFLLENISDYLIDEYDAYIAYYDKNGILISVDKTEQGQLVSGTYSKIQSNANNYKITKVKAFAWENDGMTALSNALEVSVNQPSIPEQNISIFKMGDNNAIINCKEEILNKAPQEIDGTMYISSSDFERLGYNVVADKYKVYIEDDKEKYKFVFGEYTAIQTEDNISYEISAPIINDGEILIPVVVICDLFEEKTDWHNEGNVAIINMPFDDIEYGNVFFDAILDMYNRGVVDGYDDGSYRSNETILRVSAALLFSRAMGYEFYDYDFECSDVTSDHWAKSFVGICINENVFELEDNKFRPYDCITVKETLIAALNMMGEKTENYLEVAKGKGLLTNISEENIERDITRGEMAQILYNALK